MVGITSDPILVYVARQLLEPALGLVCHGCCLYCDVFQVRLGVVFSSVQVRSVLRVNTTIAS